MRWRIWSWIFGGFLFAAAGTTAALWWRQPSEKRPLDSTTSAAAVSSTGAPDPDYVGSRVCRECHVEQAASYRRTGHSDALALIDPTQEPPDAEFRHVPSGRQYRVYRRDGELWHEEALAGAEDDTLVLNEFAVAYRIGSGRFTRSYLVLDDGFLMESPVTWYASRDAWLMSPGYDRPVHDGFERAADVGCLHCHAGRVAPLEGSMHRLKFGELSIGCERCHGPGSRHVARQSLGSDAPGGEIVNPARLSRALCEDVCAQCHLRGDATVLRRGQSFSDYRPGTPLHDNRVEYRLELPSDEGQMRVVGHVDQMRLSACYRGSSTLTCITCHDPHHAPKPAERLEYYRRICLNCHETDSCGLPRHRRMNHDDDCVTCHMPQTDTDIPHIAFTHHRIGIHHESPPLESQLGNLAPHADLSSLSLYERTRALGLGYLELSDRQSRPAAFHEYRRRASGHLHRAAQTNPQDSEVLVALARLSWESNSLDAIELARRALADGDLPPRCRVNALAVIGEMSLRAGRLADARTALGELVQLRRNSEDWRMLAECRDRLRDADGSEQALDRALQIAPGRADLWRLAADVAQQRRQFDRARACRQRARRLQP